MDSKYEEKDYNRILGIVIPYFNELIVMLFFFEENKSIVILKCSKRMLEYYFSKRFGILECNFNNLAKLPNEVKQRIHAEETDNSDYVMTCINTITSTSNTLRSCCFIKVYIIPIFKMNMMIKQKS